MSVARESMLKLLKGLARTLQCRECSTAPVSGTKRCAESKHMKGLVLGVYQGDDNEPVLTPSAKKVNDRLHGKLMDMLKCSKKNLTKGKGILFNNIDDEFWAVALVGLGKKKRGYNELEAIHEGMENVRVAAGLGARLLQKEKVGQVLVEDLGFAEQAGEGAVLALWTYQEFRSSTFWKVIPTVDLFDSKDSDAFQRGVYKAESQNLARRLCDVPANIMSPLRFAQEVVNELCPCGIKVDVHDRDHIEHNRLNAFLQVAKGSCEPPVLLVIQYCGGPEEQKPIALVGKGITYDSGGVCLKRCKNMPRYRADLTGGAAIVGAIRTASALSLPTNIVGVIPVCENMISGMAMKCGDIVMGLNGKSIRITDTDNEGRLCLADAFVYTQTYFKPRLLIDVASLTPGHASALGSGATAVYTNSQTMWAQTRKAGIISGDRVWRLPLWKYYKRQVTYFRSHDVDNKGMGYGDSPLGAAFLNQFIKCIDWIHFDTTGTGMVAEEKVYPYLRKNRMTGRPTRTLVQLLYQLSCPLEGAREFK